MRNKYKMTGCARLAIFLIVFLPIVYFGVDYYHGGDTMDRVKELFQGESKSSENEPYISKERYGINDDENIDKVRTKDAEIKRLKNKIEVLEAEIDYLKKQAHDH